MSKRKTVKVAQLEGKADAFAEMTWRLPEQIASYFREHPGASQREVREFVTRKCQQYEIEALREMTVAQRAREDEA